MTPLQAIERELHLHAHALRQLARDLVGDHAADDLVQETAVRALRSPPAEPQALWRWLSTVLRNLASKHRRAERRRTARERQAARGEALPAADAPAERADLLRRVTDAVLALPAPYQATVIARYLEALPPRAIAAREGVPLATVKSRLQRGLLLLRADLDRGRRDWRRGLLLLATKRPPALLPATGRLLMATTSTKILAAAGAGLLAAGLWVLLGGDAGLQPPDASSAAAPPPAAAAANGRPAAAPGLHRAELAAAAPAVDLSHPFAFALACRVVDRDGLPVAGAELLLAPRGCAWNRWPETTDADGAVQLRWRGRRPEMAMAIAVASAGQSLQEIAVQAGPAQPLVLLAEQQPAHAQRMLRLQAEYAAAAADCRREGGSGGDCRACHGNEVRAPLAARLAVRASLHPEAQFADLLLPSTGAAKAKQRTLARETSLVDDWLRATAAQAGAAPPAARGTLAGTVFGVDGKPCDNVTVTWGRDAADPGHRTRTRHGGRFAFEGVPCGPTPVHAGGDERGLATATVEVAAAAGARCDLFLRLGAAIRGRGFGPGAEPLANWRVDGAGDAWADAAVLRRDGGFLLPNLPPGPMRLLLWPNHDAPLPAAVEAVALPDGAEVVFDLGQRGMPEGALRLCAVLPEGLEPGRLEARVWQQDSGRGAAMQVEADGAFALRRLAAGFYRVELAGEAIGSCDLGLQWVDGRNVTDLGRVPLPPPARLRLQYGADVDGVPEFYRRRPDADVRAEPAAASDVLRLPAGDWLCLWRRQGGGLGAREFALRGGAEFELRIGD